MGCATKWDDSVDDKTSRYHTLVSLMLSSQTKDEVQAAAMRKLLERGLTPQKLLETSDEDLDKLIYSVGFHRKKVLHRTPLLLTFTGEISQSYSSDSHR